MRRKSSGVLPALLTAGMLGCGGEVQSERAPAVPPVVVEIARVEEEAVGDGLDLTGQLEADESVMLRAEMDLAIALSACPASTCNGGAPPRPLAFEVTAEAD